MKALPNHRAVFDPGVALCSLLLDLSELVLISVH
jgi:hypothetical protein